MTRTVLALAFIALMTSAIGVVGIKAIANIAHETWSAGQ